MKSKFNKNWNSSKQPRRQIKFRANAPNHIQKKFMVAPLTKSLRQRYGEKRIIIKKGDEVKITRGKFKGKQGKINIVDVKNSRIQITGVQRTKKGGEKLETWFNPSKVLLIAPDTSDNKRLRAVDGSKEKTRSAKTSHDSVKPISKKSKSKEPGVKKDSKEINIKEKKDAHKKK